MVDDAASTASQYRSAPASKKKKKNICATTFRSSLPPFLVAGVFIAKGKEDALVTLNLTPGKTVYGEKVVKVEGAEGAKIEYRVWNPFRSKLAATVLGGAANIWIAPGSKVLYLGAASGTSVSHVSDIVGPVRALALSFALALCLSILVVLFRALSHRTTARLLFLSRRLVSSTP